MFWNSFIRYGCKNFKHHMNITNNITLKGLLRRYQRKYPTFFRGMKLTFIISGLYVIGLSMIPGTTLPLQQQIKISCFGILRLCSKGWYYNIFSPSVGQYLIKLNQIILLAQSDQLYDGEMINQYFQEIREVATEEKKSLTAHNYFDLLLYSELVLQNIVRFQNRMLLDDKIRDHFEWIFEKSLEKLGQVQIKDKNRKSTIEMFYSIFQYLLNFSSFEKKSSYIHSYLIFVQKNQQRSLEKSTFCSLIAQKGIKQQRFLNNLKKIYGQTQSATTKKQILDIFQQLNWIYEKKQSK